MLYIVSQNGLRIADFHTLSVVTPEHDRDDEGVYKVFVNGMEFARYSTKEQISMLMKELFFFTNEQGCENYCFCLPAERSE